ncbi:cupin domain-containing protein [Diaphorobacter ruginosibacter]|uniref:Cupin domain-containing protein n=1 Tax=Diaphorobacter ruginosibacter TaxID=1715720 RepID=A0A7G9RRN4_9BURK|nr:cupin domain-containing protein [Diaphorobacter ruginosibacter]QNN58259.1 cupin domain-containing protein [Diaphorobacter ruginosibacter]
MALMTPFLPNADKYGPLDSRNMAIDELPWKPTPTAGIDMKILVKDDDTGLLTALFRWQPGSELALHEHVEIEQSYVLEGEFEDADGVYPAGNFVWRPKGHRHTARSPKGALVLCFFLRPNKFLGGELDGQELK